MIHKASQHQKWRDLPYEGVQMCGLRQTDMIIGSLNSGGVGEAGRRSLVTFRASSLSELSWFGIVNQQS